MTAPFFSIIILYWQSAQYLPECLQSLDEQSFKDFEIILLNNGSTQPLDMDLFTRYFLFTINFLHSEINLEFAAGNNLAAKFARGEYLILLNGDAFPQYDWLEQLRKAIERLLNCFFASRLVMALDPDRLDGEWNVNHSSGLAWRKGHNKSVVSVSSYEKEVMSACAAAGVYPRGAFELVGGFDEDFFAYMEDVDLDFRLQLQGYSCHYLPQVDIRRHPGLNDGPVVGYIGQISAHKGVDLLISAMQLLWLHYPEAQLLIAGARRPFAEKVEEMIAKLPEWQKNNIVISYDFPEDEKASLYQALDIFVYPSRYESFGISFLEAWNVYKPVIGLKVGAIPWVVDDEVNGLLVDGDGIGGLAKAIIQLIESPELAYRLAENGNQKVLTQYTWPAVASQFHAVYEEVVSRKGNAWQA